MKLRATLETQKMGSCVKRDEEEGDQKVAGRGLFRHGLRREKLWQGTWLGHMVDRRAGPKWDPMGNWGSEQGSEVFRGTEDFLRGVSVCLRGPLSTWSNASRVPAE